MGGSSNFGNFRFLGFPGSRYLKSGLGQAGLGPWVGPWQCCSGASSARRRAPAQHCHGPTQGPSPARPRPDLRYLGTWKSRSLESHGTLATKISEFWTYWNPCVKDFRILDLLEPLRQRFPDFQITPEILSIYGRSPNIEGIGFHEHHDFGRECFTGAAVGRSRHANVPPRLAGDSHLPLHQSAPPL